MQILDITLEKAKDDYLKSLAVDNYAKTSIEHYDRNLTRFILFLKRKEITKPDTITKEYIRHFIDFVKQLKHQKKNKPLSEASKNHIFASVRNFLEFCVDAEYLHEDFNYLFDFKQKKVKITKNILTESQMKEVLSLPKEKTYIGFRDKVIFEMLYNTGLRRNEMINLGIYDINFEDNVLFVKQGKGKKDRLVPFGNYLSKYLKEYIHKVRPALLQDNVCELKLFININGKALTNRGIASIMERFNKLTEFKFSCHTFRHSFATHLLKYGANILYIQRLLGHENTSTTEIYTKIYPVDLKKIILEKHPRINPDIENEEIITPNSRRRIFNIDEARVKIDDTMKIIFNDSEKILALSNVIKEKRESLMLSQSALARKTGINSRTISRLEAGKRCNNVAYMRLAEKLKIEVQEFI